MAEQITVLDRKVDTILHEISQNEAYNSLSNSLHDPLTSPAA